MRRLLRQPPSGGCVLKPECKLDRLYGTRQPPSGGCVLKHQSASPIEPLGGPAAFGRLCVETPIMFRRRSLLSPSRLRAAVC